MKKSVKFVLVTTLLCCSGLQAQVYTWVDENGKTHYSDKKPSGVNEANITEVKEADAKLNVIDSKASGLDANKMSRDREGREQEDAEKAEQLKAKEAQAWKAKNCSTQIVNERRGTAGGGSRIVGTKEVKRCNQEIPSAYQPFLSDYLPE